MSDEARTEFVRRDLMGARFRECDLSGATLRAVDVDGMQIDAPWLHLGERGLLVNGVDVAPLVEAELDRRFPGRSLRRAHTLRELRDAWARVQEAWDRAVARAVSMPAGTVDASVDGEWSFAQTLRHLVLATDVWLGQTVLERKHPFHPLGQPHDEYELEGYDMSVFATVTPTWDEVLSARADRVGMVRDFLATASEADLEIERRHPWSPASTTTTRGCLHTILNEEWEHLRFATRDLDALAAR